MYFQVTWKTHNISIVLRPRMRACCGISDFPSNRLMRGNTNYKVTLRENKILPCEEPLFDAGYF